MARNYFKLITACVLLLAPLAVLGQQEPAPSFSDRSAWLGLELPGMIIHTVNGGSAVQLQGLYSPNGEWGLWANAGYVNYRRDTLYNTLYEYQSRGGYLKGGADLYLATRKKNDVSFRLGAGLVYSRYQERGNVQFTYRPDQVPSYYGGAYRGGVESRSGALSFELRQALFFDLGRLGVQLQVQENIVLYRSELGDLPSHYLPGIGVGLPEVSLWTKRTEPRMIIPSASLYVFYALFR